MSTKFGTFFTFLLIMLFSAMVFANGDYEQKKRIAKETEVNTYNQSKVRYVAPNLTETAQLFEDFEDNAAFPPAGWTEYHTGLDTLNADTTRSFSPDSSALFDDVSGVDSSWFVTPQIVGLNANSALTFWQNQNFGSWFEYHGIWVSTGSGDPTSGDFVEVASLGAGTEDTWEKVTVGLDAYAGQDIYIAFLYTGSFADEWFLDDISVDEATTDLAVTEAIGLPSSTSAGATVNFDVVVNNVGGTEVSGAMLDIWVNGSVTSTLPVATLASGAADTLNASFTASASVGATDVVAAALQMVSGDDNQTNDTLAAGSVTIAPSSVSTINEDFEGNGSFPPLGWSEYHTGVDALIATTVRSFSPDSAALFSDVSGVDTSWFITPKIANVGADFVLSFWQNQNFGALYYEYHAIWVSTGSGDPASGDFVELDSLGVGTEDTWERLSVSLAAYEGQDIYLAFVYFGSFADEWYLDNIVVDAAQTDLAVSEFLDLPGSAGGSATVNFDVVVNNAGDTEVAGAMLDIWLNGGVTSTLAVATLASGASDTIAASITTSTSGTDAVAAALQAVSGDDNQSNDTLAASITILSGLSLPFVEMWDTTAINAESWPDVVGDVEVLDATGTASTNDFPFAVPSEPYFLALSDDPTSITSGTFDLADSSGYVVSFYESEHDLEIGKDVIIEYLNDVAEWDTLVYFPGTNNGFGVFEPFEKHIYPLPADAYHDGFRIRFSTVGALFSTDQWYFDDIRIEPHPTDIATISYSYPMLTQIPVSQPGVLSAVGLNATYRNLGDASNTGDVTVEVWNSAASSVYSDANSGVTIDALSDSAFGFNAWNASSADTGDYSIVYSHTNFQDNDAFNNELSTPLSIRNTMAYDKGNYSLNGSVNSTGRGWYSTRFSLTDEDTLVGVTMVLTTSTEPTDSFAVQVWSVENDTPSVPMATVYKGTYGDFTLPAFITFEVPGGMVLPAGDFAVVLDAIEATRAAGTFPIGLDLSALGSTNIPNTFHGKSTGAWFSLDGSPVAGVWTYIMRAEFAQPGPPDPGGPRVSLIDESFEDGVPPTGWQTLNPDGGTGWTQVAIGTSPAPGWVGGEVTGPPDGGAFVAYATWNTGGTTSNDQWIVTPQITNVAESDSFCLWLRYWPNNFADNVDIRISTTVGDDPAAYDVVVAELVFGAAGDTNTVWQKYAFKTTDYVSAGSNIYVGIREHVLDNYNDGASVSLDLFNYSRESAGPTVVLEDNFENGTANWTLEGSWATTDEFANSGTRSLTESPGGNYAPNQNISATLASGIDLSGSFGAELSFYARYNIEQGFDYMYIEASSDETPENAWVILDIFDGEGFDTWELYTYSLSGFVGNSNVKVRFRFFSDGGYEVDGMYIDDVMITSTDTDTEGPLIVHDGPAFYEGASGDFVRQADVIDISGVGGTNVHYAVDGGSYSSAASDSANGDTHYYTVPGQETGANVAYTFDASDGLGNSSAAADTFEYVAGTHIFYDDPEVDFVTNITTGNGAAVRISVPQGYMADLGAILLRTYTDVNRPFDSIEVHVWAEDNGLPGADLITPFNVWPEATLANTSPMTRVDLRDHAANLTGLTGDFFIGFITAPGPVGETWMNLRGPANGRAFAFGGGLWQPDPNYMYHFRAVVDLDSIPVGIEDSDLVPTEYVLEQNYPNPFNPTTTLKYGLKETADVTIRIYNVLGQMVKTLVNAKQTAGFKEVTWDGTNDFGVKVSSGIYVYKIQANDFVKARKMILLK